MAASLVVTRALLIWQTKSFNYIYMKRERSREGQINIYGKHIRKEERDVPLLELGRVVCACIYSQKSLISTLQVLITSLILSYTLL
jgi:hypothetical protein